MDKMLYQAVWKSKSPKRINILVWIMINGNLNSLEVLKKKLPTYYLMPSICPLYCKNCESLPFVL